MKSILLFALVTTMLFPTKVDAQHLVIAPIAEKTVSGWQYGSTISFQSKSLWSLGGFYQCDLMAAADAARSGKTFCGILVNAPLMKSEKINFYFCMRAGLANQIFVVVVPGLETELKISNKLSLSTLMSIRMTYPSAAFKVNIKF